MAASREEVDRWISEAKRTKKPFILSLCDRWDYDDFPVYCESEIVLRKKIAEYKSKDMISINEIIKIEDGIVTENISPYSYV